MARTYCFKRHRALRDREETRLIRAQLFEKAGGHRKWKSGIVQRSAQETARIAARIAEEALREAQEFQEQIATALAASFVGAEADVTVNA